MRFLRIGIAGMRGQIGRALIPPLAIDFSAALATYYDGGPLVVGCDTRVSSPMLRHAVVAALLGCGSTVHDAGIVSEPEFCFSIPRLGARGGLLIGAQHHPKGWNALQPMSATGACFSGVELQELLDVYHSRRYAYRTHDALGQAQAVPAALQDDYLEQLCGRLDTAAIAAAKLTVVADFCNGSGARAGERLAERLGVRLIAINKESSGILPHDPEPRPRSAMQVQSVLRPLQADIGFVFNSDMSRAAVVTNTGETLSEEYTLALVADQVLARRPGQTVVTNCCTTRTLDDIAARHNAQVFKTRVGQAYVIDRMRELCADLAGDGSGGAAFGAHIPAYDNFMVMGVLLEGMAQRRCMSAELAAALPRYHIVKKAIPSTSSHAYTLLRRMRDLFPDAALSEEDGCRFDWPDGWVHLRASMTEPIVRMIVEWTTREAAEDMAARVRAALERRVMP